MNVVGSYDTEANDHISHHTRRSVKMNENAANADAATTEKDVPNTRVSVCLTFDFVALILTASTHIQMKPSKSYSHFAYIKHIDG